MNTAIEDDDEDVSYRWINGRRYRIKDSRKARGMVADGEGVRVAFMDRKPDETKPFVGHRPGYLTDACGDDRATVMRDAAYADYVRRLNDGPPRPDDEWDEEDSLAVARRVAPYLRSMAIGRALEPFRPETDLATDALDGHGHGLSDGEKHRDAAYAAFLRNMRAQHPSYRS